MLQICFCGVFFLPTAAASSPVTFYNVAAEDVTFELANESFAVSFGESATVLRATGELFVKATDSQGTTSNATATVYATRSNLIGWDGRLLRTTRSPEIVTLFVNALDDDECEYGNVSVSPGASAIVEERRDCRYLVRCGGREVTLLDEYGCVEAASLHLVAAPAKYPNVALFSFQPGVTATCPNSLCPSSEQKKKSATTFVVAVLLCCVAFIFLVAVLFSRRLHTVHRRLRHKHQQRVYSDDDYLRQTTADASSFCYENNLAAVAAAAPPPLRGLS